MIAITTQGLPNTTDPVEEGGGSHRRIQVMQA